MLNRRTPRFEPLEDRRLLAVVTVDTLEDTVDLTDGRTSLREAIFAANLVHGADRIEFTTSLTGRPPATLLLTHGELRISDDLIIDWPAAFPLIIDASGSDPTPAENNGDGSRIFHVDDGGIGTLIDVTISGVTLTGGDARGNGGAILSSENLTVVSSSLTGNAATPDEGEYLSYGGGIAQRGGSLTVTGSVVSNNAGGFGSGIHFEGTSLVVVGSVIADNVGSSGVGIYHRSGDGLIQASSIRGNMAGAFSLGGGVYTSGNLRVEATTISGNAAAFGGGLFSRTETVGDNETLIVNSTISGNTAFERGGGVRNALGRTIIQHSTITANQAPPTEGGGVATRGYATSRTEVSHTIIAGNAASDVDFGTGTINTFLSRGYNVVGTGNGMAAFGAAGDQTAVTNPLLGSLADNGGPTLPDGNKLLTHALLEGSPAINAGDLNAKAGVGGVPLYDQRSEPFNRVVNGRIDIGAFEYQSASDLNLMVDTLVDESDGNFARGDLSLREAIALANLYPSDETIRFDLALTAAGPATILLTMGELRIADDVLIEGPGAELLTIDASGNDPTPHENNGDGSRSFNIDDEDRLINRSIAISRLSLTGGDSQTSAGCIFASENIRLSELHIFQNHTTDFGGAINVLLWGSAELVIDDCSFNDNSAVADGGAVYALAIANGKVTIRDSCIEGNKARQNGAGIYVAGSGATTFIVGNSISRNSGYGQISTGGGMLVSGATAIIENNLITNNSAVYGGGLCVVAQNVAIRSSSILSNSAFDGAGIYAPRSNQALLISHCKIADNTAMGFGGGISTSGAIEALNSSIINNSSELGGGGFDSFGPVAIMNSTVANNRGENGGGLRSYGPISIVNSTFSGNVSEMAGGGIWSWTVSGESAGEVLHSTIAGNLSAFGGGIFLSVGVLAIDHSIVANNQSQYGTDLFGIVDTRFNARFSLIGHSLHSGLTPAPIGSPDANGNLIGGPNFGQNINSRLGPLTDNGGPTLTHGLLPGSPAIDAGDPAAVAGVGDVPLFDQRGAPFPRVYGGRIDIGAFEWQPIPVGGDYDGNGIVDAADFVVWRKTLGSATDLRADGNRDGLVDDADRIVWRTNFGSELTAEQGVKQHGAWSGEQGARKVFANSVATVTAEKAPALPGVRPVQRTSWRPASSSVALHEDLLTSLVSPRAIDVEREEFAPRKRDSMDGANDPHINALDNAFAALGVE